MEYQKIINLLDKTRSSTKLPKYNTRKRIEIYDQSNGTYNTHKDIRFKTPQLRSSLCDFNDAYVVVIGKISATNQGDASYDIELALKNNAPFFSSILKISSQLVEDAQDLDIVLPM